MSGNYLESYIRKTEIIKLGGKDFKFSELSLADFAQFSAWANEQRDKKKDKRRERIIKEAEKIGGIDPERVLDKLSKPMTDEEVEAEMETIEGMGYLAYLSLKYAYPEISKDEAMQLITITAIEKIAGIMVGGVKDDKKKSRTPNTVKP